MHFTVRSRQDNGRIQFHVSRLSLLLCLQPSDFPNDQRASWLKVFCDSISKLEIDREQFGHWVAVSLKAFEDERFSLIGKSAYLAIVRHWPGFAIVIGKNSLPLCYLSNMAVSGDVKQELDGLRQGQQEASDAMGEIMKL